MAEERRIIWDDEDKDIYADLRSRDGPLKKLDNSELFAIALVLGKKEGKRTEFGKGRHSGVRGNTIDATNVRYLMKAIAVEEEGKIEAIYENCYKTEKDLENESNELPFLCSRFGECHYRKKPKFDDGIKCHRYFNICEQYAKTGVKILREKYDELGDDILDEMEFELLEFIDDNFK